MKVGLVEHRDAISKSEGEIVNLNEKLHTAYTDISEVQDALSAVKKIVTGHGNQLVTAKNAFDKSQGDFKMLMDQQVELNIEKFAQIDNRLFTSANVIDALK